MQEERKEGRTTNQRTEHVGHLHVPQQRRQERSVFRQEQVHLRVCLGGLESLDEGHLAAVQAAADEVDGAVHAGGRRRGGGEEERGREGGERGGGEVEERGGGEVEEREGGEVEEREGGEVERG